jgi:hypothetical protein
MSRPATQGKYRARLNTGLGGIGRRSPSEAAGAPVELLARSVYSLGPLEGAFMLARTALHA